MPHGAAYEPGVLKCDIATNHSAQLTHSFNPPSAMNVPAPLIPPTALTPIQPKIQPSSDLDVLRRHTKPAARAHVVGNKGSLSLHTGSDPQPSRLMTTVYYNTVDKPP